MRQIVVAHSSIQQNGNFSQLPKNIYILTLLKTNIGTNILKI